MVLLNLGWVFAEKGAVDEAIARYRQAIRLRPGYAPAHSNLGAALLQKGLLDDGIAACREAIRLKPDDATAVLPANYTFTAADSGMHTFTGLKLKKKGTQTITFTDTLSGALTDSLTINVT